MQLLKNINILLILIIIIIGCGGINIGNPQSSSDEPTSNSPTTGSTEEEIEEGIESSGEEGTVGESGYVVPTMASLSAVRSSIFDSNPNGILGNELFNEIELPLASMTVSSNLTSTLIKTANSNNLSYSVSGLPDYMEFISSSRKIKLKDGYNKIPKGQARRAIPIQYRATNGEEYSEVTIILNDIDGDSINDCREHEKSVLPLLNREVGMIWLNSNNQSIYRHSNTNFKTVPSGIVSIPDNTGMNLADPNDGDEDFDDDGLTNKEELLVGRNPFVYTGTGTMSVDANYPADKAIWFGMSTGDFDDDGDQDIVAVEHSNSPDDKVYLWENNGNGVFEDAISISVGRSPQNISVADFNNDGDMDFAVTSFNEDEVSVLLGDGTLDFTRTDYNAGEDGSQPRSISSADLNGDGWQDLTITHSNTCYLSVLINDGDGTFANRVDYTTCTNNTGNPQEEVIALDVDGDLDLDLAVISYGVNILLNNGNGIFGSANNYGGGGFGLIAFDTDDDGDLDIAYSGNGENINILVNDGDGVYGLPTHGVIARDWSTGRELLNSYGELYYVEMMISYSVPSSPRGKIIASDFNGDGMIDMATANYTANTISILFGQVENSGDILGRRIDYAVSHPNPIRSFHPACLVAADFDGDGDIDLATGGDDPGAGIIVLLNQSI